MKKKLIKIFSIVAVIIVLFTMTLIPTFAATYTPIVPINFSNYGSFLTAVAFPGAHSLPLYIDGGTINDYLDSDDYNNEEGTRILYGDLFNNGQVVPYIQIYLATNYSSIYFNNVVYNGSLSAPGIINEVQLGVTSISSYPVASSYSAGITYHYTFNIVLGEFFDYDTVYKEAYEKGKEAGFDEGVIEGSKTGFLKGLEKGREQSESANLGLNLIGPTLAAPMTALNSFVLFQYDGINGPADITLGEVIGGCIALVVFIAFLKIFAGG